MNVLPIEKRAQIIGMLDEDNSMRSVTRMTRCSINTVTKLLVDVGAACSECQDKVCVTRPASAFSAMKYGRSATARKRM